MKYLKTFETKNIQNIKYFTVNTDYFQQVVYYEKLLDIYYNICNILTTLYGGFDIPYNDEIDYEYNYYIYELDNEYPILILDGNITIEEFLDDFLRLMKEKNVDINKINPKYLYNSDYFRRELPHLFSANNMDLL